MTQRPTLITLIALFLASLVVAAPAHAERIKDMGQFQGLRANQLTGYGIVVGLAGTGDDSLDYSTLGMKGAVSRFGLTLPAGVNPALKNAAAVMITAELPPFAKPGQRLDVTVSAIGKAKSLRGGTLVLAPLYGADGQIYAMVQGNLVIGGLGVDAADGSKLTVNVPSSGRIAGGATVERAVDTGFATSDQLTFNLHQFDATNAKRVADAINQALPGSATMIDGASIAIRAGGGGDERMRLMSRIENLAVVRSEPPARVIVNARTGTVVINGAVRVGTAAVSQGKLTVSIKESPMVVQPAPFSRGETAVEQSSDIGVDQEYRPMMMVKPTASLSELVDAINRMGVPPGDLVAILEALSQAGALTAELVII
ncbi:flagellar biosynthesis protein FlgI [Sphingopyxis lindanitolerans]|uniref:Flagellar P-ring protein n=1 Tax=Sphingopyxis lindanitolerans TaxID=2054227 RepID=A0A2S8B8P2_9SPHN|nr:flagellar basal body P-ring protein FlgI [Sphingopyxis lindanitolerans]PQM28775.1 flagellar biosynthesis protein FlgI [Sphingopyxis lindanitolerans]